jgi:hypothetical protein
MSLELKILIATTSSCVVLATLLLGWSLENYIMNLKSSATFAVFAILAIFSAVFIISGCTKEKLYTQHIPPNQHEAAPAHRG